MQISCKSLNRGLLINLSKVKILNAFSPKIILGIGVVPPVPRTNNILNEMPKNKWEITKANTLETKIYTSDKKSFYGDDLPLFVKYSLSSKMFSTIFLNDSFSFEPIFSVKKPPPPAKINLALLYFFIRSIA